ncbi:MAG: hypothetical protein RML72_11600 [Bacteroidia bacterium]|nr:hypothetical protein [Bacteroidia bacterium]MDW8159501.1 hypothetical protein [Bacteroidia bacterium]
MQRLHLLVIFLFFILANFNVSKGQTLSRLDEDRGAPAYRIETDLTEAYYLGEVVEERNYLVRKAGKEVSRFLGGEVLAVRYFHKNFIVGQIVIFIKKEYDLVVKKKLLDMYGRPSRFSTQGGVESAAWIAPKTSLFLDLNYKSVEPIDKFLDGQVAVIITQNGFAHQEIIERIEEP